MLARPPFSREVSMNKPLAAALLILSLNACSRSEPASSQLASNIEETTAPPAHVQLPSTAPASMQAQALPVVNRRDEQTDRAIDQVLGDHVAYHQAFTDFQEAVAKNDVSAVAAMVHYPMTVSVAGEKVVIDSPAKFKQYYGALIPPQAARSIAAASYSSTVINKQGARLDDGRTWLGKQCNDPDCKTSSVKIVTIDPQL
jgi:hypothetical protein